MKPNTVDLSAFKYCSGHTYYNIDLTGYNNAVNVYLEIRSKEDVSVELIQSGSGDVLHFLNERNIKFKAAIINCDGIIIRTKKTARLAYICNATPHGGYEKMDPRPMVLAPAKSEFLISDLIRRELTKRLNEMGMSQGDVDDLLDEDDFTFDDDDAEELPEDTPFTEMEEEEPDHEAPLPGPTIEEPEPDDTDPQPEGAVEPAESK